MSDAVMIALISALGGGILLELTKRLASRAEWKESELSLVRRELRERNAQNEARIAVLENQVDEWQAKYYTLANEYVVLKAEHSRMAIDLERIQKVLDERGGGA